MSSFTKSIFYSGAVLAVGLIAIFAIYDNVAQDPGFAGIEPAAGEEETLGETIANEAGEFGDAVEETTGEALEATGEAIEAAGEEMKETGEEMAEGAEEAAEAAEDAAEATEEAAEEIAEEDETASETEPASGDAVVDEMEESME
jgi:methyl-accepting chemotaxis protein